jgi:antibiotic biosynthesis monooxygenase (ABM) superfamily enzyme
MIPRTLLTRLANTLAAWLAAFVTVVALLTLFRDELGSLPLVLRALVISGVLVFLMANAVMPVLGPLVARLLSERPRKLPHPEATTGRIEAETRQAVSEDKQQAQALPHAPSKEKYS